MTSFLPANENERCQRKGLYVDFDILGWKQWVIAPEGFSAFYCSGDCSAPFSKEMNATSHAIVQSTLHRVRPNSTTPAKCAPSSLGSYKILFVDQNKQVQIKRYRDMVVDECGCHWEEESQIKFYLFIQERVNIFINILSVNFNRFFLSSPWFWYDYWNNHDSINNVEDHGKRPDVLDSICARKIFEARSGNI